MLERPTTSRIALSATAFTVPSGFWMLNRIVADAVRLDPPQHGEIHVDDVLVAGQHQAFLRHVAHRAAAPRRILDQRHADAEMVETRSAFGSSTVSIGYGR